MRKLVIHRNKGKSILENTSAKTLRWELGVFEVVSGVEEHQGECRCSRAGGKVERQ